MDFNNEKISNSDNDMLFMPLNIKQELNPSNAFFPLILSLDGLSLSLTTNNTINNISMPDLKNSLAMPVIPYPNNVPNLENTTPIKNTEEINLEYPSEDNSDDLFSYNESRSSKDLFDEAINPLDILRNFDLTPEFNEYRSSDGAKDIEDIYAKIMEKNPGVLATLKAYRIPYPLAKLIIKKIISLTLKYEQR